MSRIFPWSSAGMLSALLLVAGCSKELERPATEVLEQTYKIHKAQLLSYMKILNVPVGLLINFHEMKLTSGIHRLILPGANR